MKYKDFKTMSQNEMKNLIGGNVEEDDDVKPLCVACTKDDDCKTGKVCRSSPSCTDPKVCAKPLIC